MASANKGHSAESRDLSGGTKLSALGRNIAPAQARTVAGDRAQGGRRARSGGLDGIRALAVLAVMAFHEGLPWMPGGFLGVDVFFVLSGYLITDLLVAQFERDGRLGLRGFWVRRARRLLPALAVVLVTVTAAVTVFEPEEIPALRDALLGAMTFSSNWSQAMTHQSYFTAFGPPPPLQHLWSLAVEEQFYLIWPLVLALVLAGTHRKRLAAGLAWAGAAASAAVMAMVYVPGSDPSLVYYGTDTHASGLLIGAALALTFPLARLSAVSALTARQLDYAGVLGLAALAYAVTHFAGSDSALYPDGLVFAALSAAAVVAAAAAPGRIARILGWGPLRWLGVRSYGIYLWHWPVIALAGAVAGPRADPALTRLAETAVPIALAAASWRWIEEPVLRRGFREVLRQRRAQIGGALAAVPRSPARVLPLGAAGAFFAVACVAGYGVLNPPGGPTLEQQIAAGEKIAAASQAGHRAGRDRDPAATVAAAHQPRGEGSMVTAIGDSVMLSCAEGLEYELPGIYINAFVSRQMDQGVQVIQQLAARGQLRPIVLLGLGTNGNMAASEISQVRRAIGPHRWLVLINTYEPRPWEEPVNDIIAAAASHDPNVRLVNWYGAIENHTNMLRDDQVHPLPPGAVLYATLIKAAIGSLPPTPPTSLKG
jgi:peptidoglycan/LPS O-acetylase OafA/YrhL